MCQINIFTKLFEHLADMYISWDVGGEYCSIYILLKTAALTCKLESVGSFSDSDAIGNYSLCSIRLKVKFVSFVPPYYSFVINKKITKTMPRVYIKFNDCFCFFDYAAFVSVLL